MPQQLTIFGPVPRPRKRKDEQTENLERVSHRIAWHIASYYAAKMPRDPCFHADDLRRYVMEREAPIAPGSTDRILRDMRRKHLLNYRIVSRSKSLYEFLPKGANTNEVPNMRREL